MSDYGFIVGLDGTEETDPIKITAAAMNLVEEQRKRLDRAIALFELEQAGKIVVLDEAIKTNADRFRSLSDEELAEQLVINIDGLAPTRVYLSAVTGIGYISRKFAVDATKKALQQPYKEDA